MQTRRSDRRFELAAPWPGSVRVLNDVRVGDTDSAAEDLVILSRAPATVGAAVVVDVNQGGEARTLHATVTESRPVLRGGVVRHHIRLAVESSETAVADQAECDGPRAPRSTGAGVRR